MSTGLNEPSHSRLYAYDLTHDRNWTNGTQVCKRLNSSEINGLISGLELLGIVFGSPIPSLGVSGSRHAFLPLPPRYAPSSLICLHCFEATSPEERCEVVMGAKWFFVTYLTSKSAHLGTINSPAFKFNRIAEIARRGSDYYLGSI